MKIHVTKSDGFRIVLKVTPSELISSVKTKLQDTEGVTRPRVKSQLFFDGRMLADDQTVSHYGIKNSAQLDFRPMQLFLTMNLDGPVRFIIEVEPSTTVETVKNLELYGIDPEGQRLILDGHELDHDGLTLSDYNVQHKSTIIIYLHVPGIICTLTARPNNVERTLIDYLMLDDSDRQHANVPIEALRKMSISKRAVPGETFSPKMNGDILSAEHRSLLSDFLDFLWAIEPSPGRVDLRVVLCDDLFVSLIGKISGQEKAMSILNSLRHSFNSVSSHKGGIGGIKIALRMTKGPSDACIGFHCDACIGFHCDGEYVTATVQVALNGSDEYEGGRLCFFVNDTLHVLEQPAGSVVQHKPKVLHGVTAMIDGTRKSLFVVDQNNDLGETDVLHVPDNYVHAFLLARVRQDGTCIICMDAAATMLVYPCGHKCMCSACSRQLLPTSSSASMPQKRCPACRGTIQGTTKVFLV